MKLTIKNINVKNQDYLYDILASAGYASSYTYLNDTTAQLNLDIPTDVSQRAAEYYMIEQLLEEGFTVELSAYRKAKSPHDFDIREFIEWC
jgi:hypothetical protein